MVILFIITLVILGVWVLFVSVSPERFAYNTLELPREYRIANTSHGKTAYRLVGPKSGALVVCVHGIGAASVVFDELVLRLTAKGYQVLTFDLYGQGFSARPKQQYTVSLFEEQLHELLVFLGVNRPFDLLGGTMGATLAAGFAAKHPKSIRKLILLSPMLVPRVPATMKYRLMGWCFGPWLARNFPGQQMQTTLKPDSYPALRQAIEEQMEIRGTWRALNSTFKNVVGQEHRSSFRGVGQARIPTLICWGNDDPLFPYEDHLEVQELTAAVFRGVLSAGHLICVEKPDYVATQLLAFLEADTNKGDTFDAENLNLDEVQERWLRMPFGQSHPFG